jgi:hypothetical protein
MKRRTFLKSTLAAVSLAGLAPAVTATAKAAENDGAKSQFYELRVYSLKTEEQQKLIGDYWRDAAIPALNRLGVKPVGAFVELENPEVTKIWVLIPYDSLEVFASVPAGLAADAEYQRAGAPYLEAPKSAPAYDRFESNLLVAFDGMKKLEVPVPPSPDKPRVFELRTYQSRSEGRAVNKVLMFNRGEIPTMREVNLGPVFFAESLVGTGMPNLIYMVSSENMEEHKKHWAGFFNAPTWNKLKDDPQYKDNVSKVISTFLKRTSYSQI